MRNRLPAVALVAALLAGCTGVPPQTPGPDLEELPEPAWSPLAVAVGPCRFSNCFEPTVAANARGTLFVADGQSGPIGVSTDGGLTFTLRDAPPYPDALGSFQADVLLQVSPEGRLYYSAIIIAGSLVLAAIQVAWSDDEGKTWAGNVLLDPVSAPGSPIVYPDRQWLGFAADGTLLLTYNQPPSGIWFARSGDGGSTWTDWTRAAPLEARGGGFGQSGPPVEAGGAILVPACSADDETTLVFRSTDGGATFAAQEVPMGCNWFPMLAAQGPSVALAVQSDLALRLAFSDDGGASFGPVQEWGRFAVASPWPAWLADGSLVVAWHQVAEQGWPLVRILQGDASGPWQDVVAGQSDAEGGSISRGGLTDFATAAILPDGRVATAWTQGREVVVRTAPLPLQPPSAPSAEDP